MIMKKQNKTNRWLAALLMLGAVMLVGCVEHDNPIVETQNGVAFADDALTDGVLLVDPYADNMTFDITTNGEWRIEQDARFFSVEPESGSGPATVTLFLQTNNREERKTGHLTVVFPANEAKNQTVTIEQKWKGEMPAKADTLKKTNRIYGLGYGYNTLEQYANAKSVKAEIFDTQRLVAMGKMGLSSPLNNREEMVVTGSSVSELTNKLAVKANVSGGFGKFKAEANSTFDMDYAQSSNYEYAIAYLNLVVGSAHFDFTFGQLVGKYMTEEAYEDINGVTRYYSSSRANGLKNLVNDYGTHVIVNSTLGGRVKYSVQVDITNITSAYDIGAFAKAGYGSAFVTGSASIDEEFKASFNNNKKSISTSIHVEGGDDSLSKKLGSSGGFTEENIEAWVQSVSEDNMALVGFESNSLVPLYELVDEDEYPERYQALKDYIESGMASDPDASPYNCGTVTEFDVPTFDSKNGTLVKDVYVGGQWVGQVCEEYIPVINRDQRIQVVYPVINNQARYNMGFFLGNGTHKPARIAWNGSNVSVYEYSDLDFGKVDKLYLRGASISPVLYEGMEPKAGEVRDEYLTALNYETPTKDYALVKIFDHIWMREDYAGVKTNSGVSLDPNRTYYPDYYWRSDTKKVYYSNGMIWADPEHGIHTPGFAPPGWELPSCAQFNTIRDKLVANGISMVGNAFLANGVLGFDATVGGVFELRNASSKTFEHVFKDRASYWPSDIYDMTGYGDWRGYIVDITNSDITFWNAGMADYYRLVRFVKK